VSPKDRDCLVLIGANNIKDAMQNAPERLVNDAESPKKDTNGLPVNPLSWFGIASIHGQPYVTWNKAPHFVFDTDTKKTQPRGYCRHGSTLFPTWHRAYLALFEVSSLFRR
jgi:hypothetical protein